MMPLGPQTAVKVALAAIGLGVWAYGYRFDSVETRWVGIAFMAAAVLMRFVGGRGSGGEK
jgi:hypothetical protein